MKRESTSSRERLNQNSKNSSIPPSSEAPWDKASHYEDEEQDDESSGDIEALDKALHADKQALASDCCADEINTPSPPSQESSDTATQPAPPQVPPRKPGKQPGAQGFGREQKITVHQHEHHYPTQCVLCDDVFNAEHTCAELSRSNSVAYTAFDTLTLKWGDLSNCPKITCTSLFMQQYDLMYVYDKLCTTYMRTGTNSTRNRGC